jgi:hypothetical protein
MESKMNKSLDYREVYEIHAIGDIGKSAHPIKILEFDGKGDYNQCHACGSSQLQKSVSAV